MDGQRAMQSALEKGKMISQSGDFTLRTQTFDVSSTIDENELVSLPISIVVSVIKSGWYLI